MYNIKKTIEGFQKRAKFAGISISRLCRLADIESSMFYKWKRGDNGALLSSLEKIEKELIKLETKQQKEKQS